MIPALVYAIEVIELTINVNIEISNSYPVNYIIYETVKISEKSNYEIFDFSEYGMDKLSCRPIEGQTEYEFCAIIDHTEMHAAGESVDIPTEITYHLLQTGGDNSLYQTTASMDQSSSQVNYYFNESNLSRTYCAFVYHWWIYSKDLNQYDDIDEMSFTGSVFNNWQDTSQRKLDLYAPNSFTMPRHGVFFLEEQLSTPGYC